MDEAENSEPRPAEAPPLRRGVPLLWALVAIAIAALTAAGALSLIRADQGPRPAFLDAPPQPASSARRLGADRSSALVLAGSGSNLPLTRALALAFVDRDRGAKIVVAESIGSAGGVRAAHEGSIDVGLVSRPLSEQESKLDLAVTPYARVPVVVAANSTATDACVASGNLAGMWSGQGETARWSDGSPVIVLQRERGDSSFLAMTLSHPELGVANELAYDQKRWRVLYDDRSMQEALMATEGALGLFDLGQITAQRLPLRVLCVDGVAPSVEAVLSGRYPYFKDLAFVTRRADAASEPVFQAFLAFVRSSEGRAIAGALGYAPLPLAAAGGAP